MLQACFKHHVCLQVSDHLDIGRDESDESKIASLSAIHAVGDPLFVKVWDTSDTYPGF